MIQKWSSRPGALNPRLKTGKKSEMSDTKESYLHGYSKEEQDRLYEQARFLEDKIYQSVDFSKCSKLLEIGSGVGAQTEILLERFPHITIDCVDTSKTQLDQAALRLKKQIAENRVRLHLGDGGKLPFPEDSFDGVFICWLLEHVEKPVEILNAARHVLKSGGMISCTEVLNSSFYIHPYSPKTLHYWMSFNDHQWTLGGDPFVGGKLGNYLQRAGFQDIQTKATCFHYDNRMPKMRGKMFEYWSRLLLSGTPSLLKAGKTTDTEVREMTNELSRLKSDPDAVFFYSCIQASARVY